MFIENPPSPGRYIDPLVDFAFKKIFGSEPNKDLLIAFLNDVFRGRKVITDLSYSQNEHPGEITTEGGAIFDLLCTGSKGESFIIEVQRGRQITFKERALFYTSRLISAQSPKGESNSWRYDLKEVYLIALLEDFTLAGSPAGEYVHDISLCYRNTGMLFYDKLSYTFIELNKFVKKEIELVEDLDKWLYVLKNMSHMEKLPVYLRKPIFEKLFQIAEYTNLSKEEKLMYDTNLKYKWDNESVRETARIEGREEGREEGIKEGIKEGLKEGAIAIALEMKNDGLPFTQIAKFTKLTLEEIENLQ